MARLSWVVLLKSRSPYLPLRVMLLGDIHVVCLSSSVLFIAK